MPSPVLAASLLFATVQAAEPALPAPSAAQPDERPLFAWADRCPSTAMEAGFYAGAVEVASATHAGKPVLRVRFLERAAAGTERQTTWMLAEGCRAVALVREGSGREVVTSFVVTKSREAPSAEEQATLQGWVR